jgi:glycosyltransferase involved in cell wall biosynthesis
MATVAHLITGLETGGAERTLTQLVCQMDRERYRSVVISMTGPGSAGSDLVNAGIELHTLDLRRGMPDPRGPIRLARVLRTVRPDILQTWLYHADLLGMLGGRSIPACRLVWNVRCTEAVGASVVRRVLAWCSTLPDAVIVNSRAGKRFHEALGYRPRRWEHIPNGYDTNVFRFDAQARARLRGELGIAENAVVIGMAARYHPMKDHANFLVAAACLAAVRPETVFVFAGPGTGPSNRLLAHSIAAHGLGERVRLLGERSDMPELYSALDIATLSSAFGEGCPNVLGEAMSCGLPCVATDCGDAAEILGPSGAVVPPRDPAGLTAAWTRLIALGPTGRRAIGAEARARVVRAYDLRTVVGYYDAVYTDMAEEHRPARSPAQQGQRNRA